MTDKQFDEQEFSMYTLIATHDSQGLENIIAVNFYKRTVTTPFYGEIKHTDIIRIQND